MKRLKEKSRDFNFFSIFNEHFWRSFHFFWISVFFPKSLFRIDCKHITALHQNSVQSFTDKIDYIIFHKNNLRCLNVILNMKMAHNNTRDRHWPIRSCSCYIYTETWLEFLHSNSDILEIYFLYLIKPFFFSNVLRNIHVVTTIIFFQKKF